LSNQRKPKPLTVFAVVPDQQVENVFIAMWNNYLGETKTMVFEADDEMKVYQRATAYLNTRRRKKRDRA
jgi:hypothetical protein